MRHLKKAMKKNRENGADKVSFKCFEKGALAVGHSCCGSYLIEVTHSLNCALVTNPNVRREKLNEELDCDISFPMIDVSKLTMKDGCSSTDEHNRVLGSIMQHEAVLAWMAKNDKIQEEKGKAVDDEDFPDKKTGEEAGQECDFFSEVQCV
jgi:hypothetical protein